MQHVPELCYLPFMPAPDEHAQTTWDMALRELSAGLAGLSLAEDFADVTLLPGEGEGFEILRAGEGFLVRGQGAGALYGVYRLLMRLAAGLNPAQRWTEPAHALRMLNHWDNMDGTVERGYAGKSLFFRDGRFCYDKERLRLYARYLAAVGINAVCLNNVNVRPPSDRLPLDFLPDVARVADLFRPFGVRLLLAVEYALPVACGLPTADPLDAEVQALWQRVTDSVYAAVPDLCGYLVKADSEFRPGPYRYGRDHAQGASPLARALAPHGGVLVWRCFVYNCRQDWRDTATDRPKAAFENYARLDGAFDDNVILQIKHGPYDFQVSEPPSPLLMAMPGTAKAAELQLAQEYTGQQIDLYFMLPLWQSLRAQAADYPARHISAVANTGDDDNWTGHQLALANLFAYGLFAWQADIDARQTALWFARLTVTDDAAAAGVIADMLLRSREIYRMYAAPLGLCWMVNPGHHYGPNPEGYEYAAWGTYLRADRQAVGIDRTSAGTGMTSQYPPALAARYDNPDTCPEEYLLFFHRLRYDRVLPCGKTLIQRMYDLRFEGARCADELAADWESVRDSVPPVMYRNVRERLERQLQNAREWRDVCNTYFYRYSGARDDRSRPIY